MACASATDNLFSVCSVMMYPNLYAKVTKILLRCFMIQVKTNYFCELLWPRHVASYRLAGYKFRVNERTCPGKRENMKKNSGRHKFLGGWRGLRELLPNNSGAFSQIFASLKNRNFRLYFGGQCVSLVGTWMQQIAMSWLVFRLTGSVFLLATVTFMAQIPVLVVTPYMSVFVDRFNRRALLVVTQSLSMVQALLMALLTLTGWIEVWHIMVLSLLIGLINALDNPTRQSFYPSLVPAEKLGNAIALNSAVINGSRLIGPAVGGVLIGLLGEGICFLLNGVSYIAVIIALLMMRIKPNRETVVKQRVWEDMRDGFLYVAHDIPIRSLLLLMSAISFFGLPLMTFIPAYVKTILGGESEMLGLLLSCVGVGSFIAALYLAARKSVLGLGKVVMLSGALLGIGLVVMSFVTVPWVAAVLCVPVGFTIIAAVASINTLLQTLSREDKRGRVMGYMAMAFTGMAPVGSMVLGAIEKFAGLQNIILLSGACCFIASLIFEHYRPIVRKYARPVYVEKGIIKEIAEGIGSVEEYKF
ncbi:MFS transporter [uncultured Butyricimonas sp.]|uniref:MFS transporter n=1 Tax=uncultured Butyricimonas sp. TaxID=1268785 RepID=UPI0026DBB3DA|nr:MFS transporter [uncultured Butyricimonas sp.]